MGTVLKIIEQEFSRLKAYNDRYSLRSFSRKLGVTPSSLSQVLNCKRAVTPQFAQKVLKRLNFSPDEVAKYSGECRSSDAQAFRYLEMDEFFLVKEWHHFALYELMGTHAFVSDPKWIAKRLGITIPKARASLKQLVRLGFIQVTASGDFARTGKALSIQSRVPSEYIRNSHRETASQALRSLDVDSFEACDFSSSTVPVDLKRIPKAKLMIREFRRKLSAYLSGGDTTEVYKVFLGLMPLTQFDQSVFKTKTKGET